MTDKEMMNAACKGCGSPLGTDEQGAEYCDSCMIERAEQYVPEAAERPHIRREKKSRAWLVVKLILLLVCITIIALQTPRFIAALQEDQPLRYGTYATDAQADQCIKNLWHVAKLLQEGQLHTNGMVCPVSKKPYAIRDTDEDIVVRCPNPELHGFKEIQVSKRRPVPELRK